MHVYVHSYINHFHFPSDKKWFRSILKYIIFSCSLTRLLSGNKIIENTSLSSFFLRKVQPKDCERGGEVVVGVVESHNDV